MAMRSHPTRRLPARCFCTLPLALILAVGAVRGAGARAACWPPPVLAPVVDPFRPPECPWCAGNRGLEYATSPGQAVRAVAGGVVSFAGDVAGVVYVTVDTVADTTTGRSPALVTYGRLGVRLVGRGHVVRPGDVIGRTGHDLLLTVRRGGEYVDPALELGRWERRARLTPVDGTPGRPPPPARLRCGPARRARAPGQGGAAL